MNLTETCVRKPVLAWMLMAATIVFGIVAASRIGISQFPDVDFPNISVSVAWEGAAPEVIENDIVEVLEEALVQVEGMRTITSYCRMGSANITLELDISRDVDFALQDVQAKVSQAQRRLPRDIDPPVISKSNPEDQPILFISLAGPFPQRVLSDYVRYSLKEKLQTIPGVGEITMMGAQDRNVRVWLDATKLDETEPDGEGRDRGAAARACRASGGKAGDAGPGDERPGAGRGHRLGDAEEDRCPRGERKPDLSQRCGARRGRVRGHQTDRQGQRRPGTGSRPEEAARGQRRVPWPGRRGRPSMRSRRPCPRA